MTKIKLVPDSLTKEMDAKEFLEFALKRPYLIKRSRFVPPEIGSNSMGRFLVEFENEHATRSKSRTEALACQ